MTRQLNGDTGDAFVAIYSLRRRWIPIWSTLFSIFWVVGMAIVSWTVASSGAHNGFGETMTAIFDKSGGVTAAALGGSYVLTEVGRACNGSSRSD